MITVSQIRNGTGYLSRHLSANDYYSEGERVEGYWLGKGAEKLGLSGTVREAEFEALRTNRQPFTGEKLTPRQHKVAFHDIVVSAPKAFSIAAIVGQDERLMAAFHEASRQVLVDLENYAAVRVRTGEMVKTEAIRTTGNVACALFHHDSSRMLGPQLHTHLVIANVSYDKQQQRWLALQPRMMLEESKNSIRAKFHDDLAQRAEKLGYQVFRENGEFHIRGVSLELEERFSQRSGQRRQFEQRYRELFQREASKERIEAFIKEGRTAAKARFVSEYEGHFQRKPTAGEVDGFVKDWRSARLKKTSTEEVRRNQLNQLSLEERHGLAEMVAHARKISQGHHSPPQVELEKPRITIREGEAIRHVPDIVKKQNVPKLPPLKRENAALPKKENQTGHSNSRHRQELLRKIKRGKAITQAMRGHPGALIARTIRTASRR